MCKTKAYTENMDAMNESVAFRFDFYSMPSFKNNFVELLRKNLPVQQFTERLLTEEEKQKINIDAISYTFHRRDYQQEDIQIRAIPYG